MRSRRASELPRGALITAFVALIASAALAAGDLDHFQCYEIHPPGAFERTGIAVLDQFGAATVDLRKAYALCAPANKNGESPDAESHPGHLASYGVQPRSAFPRIRDREVTNQFGSLRVDVVKPARLLVPTAKSLDGPPSSPVGGLLDHFQCYKVKRARGAPRFGRLAGVRVETQFEETSLDVVRPLRLCAPASKNGEDPGAESHPDNLLCYRTRSAGGLGARLVFLGNQLGQQSWVVGQRRELCVPSVLGSTTTSTTTSSTTSTTLECGAFPTCGGGLCPDGLTCGTYFDVELTTQQCLCFPNDVTPCGDSPFPTCDGTCLDGKACRPFAFMAGPTEATLCGCVSPDAVCGPLFPAACTALGACPPGLVCNALVDIAACACLAP